MDFSSNESTSRVFFYQIQVEPSNTNTQAFILNKLALNLYYVGYRMSFVYRRQNTEYCTIKITDLRGTLTQV